MSSSTHCVDSSISSDLSYEWLTCNGHGKRESMSVLEFHKEIARDNERIFATMEVLMHQQILIYNDSYGPDFEVFIEK